jgi:hypothetical protein
LGNAPAHELFELIQVNRPDTPRSFADYQVTGPGNPPAGVAFRWVVEPKPHVR